MSVTVKRSDELECVWLYLFSKKWTWEEVFIQFEEEIHGAKEDPLKRRYDVVIDMLASHDIPNHSLPTFHSLLKRRLEMGGRLTVLVANSIFLRILEPPFRALYPKEGATVYIVKTLPEAYQLIRQDRMKLAGNSSV